jgi:aminopeptidase N
MSLLYLREKYGQDEFCNYLTECRSEVVEAFAEYGGSSVTYEFAFILSRGQERRNAVVLKTLLMFEALKEEVGEELFLETLRRFIADHKEENVTMETFKQEFERLSGKDLDQFFEQYYYEINIPHVMCS